MSAALSFRDVHLRLGGREVLRGFSLEVQRGEVVALLGPSGSGKTTLVRMALGLLAPDRGHVVLGGQEATRGKRLLLPPEERGLAVVFQDLALWPHLSVRGNLEFGLRAKGVVREERDARVRHALERVGLAGREDRSPAVLSGGERQRVAIARALVLKPHLVLLDEPLANLDPQLKREIIGLFRSVLGQAGPAALYVTHDPREARALGGRWAVLEEGFLVQEGTLADLRSAPQSAFVRVLVEEADGQRIE